jgi:hypothetical protein
MDKPSPPTYLIQALILSTFPFFFGCTQSVRINPDKADNSGPPCSFLVTKKLPPAFADEVDEIKWEFPVVNQSSEVARVVHVEKSCTCAKTELGQRELEPGEKTTLHLQAEVRGRSGPQRFWCDLQIENGAVWRYEVEVSLVRRLQVEPDLVSFGTVAAGREYERQLS